MLKLITRILSVLIDFLPDSPFQNILEQNFLAPIEDMIPFINYFLPFDRIVQITTSWLACILAYYVWSYLKKVITHFIIKKL